MIDFPRADFRILPPKANFATEPLTLLGVVVGVPILLALTLWLIYRMGRGWLRRRDRRPMETP